MNEFYRVKASTEIKEADIKKGEVSGYASIFNNVDSDEEMIIQGAFAKTLSERGVGSAKPRIKHLWQHDSWQPIAIPTVLKEDERGLFFVSKFGTDSFSQDKLKQHIDGIITELSIGFQVIKREDITNDDGKREYTKLIELKLWEYSSVTWGANKLTEIISAKNLSNEDKLEAVNNRMTALVKALKNNYKDEDLEKFEIELKQIQEIYNSLIEAAPDDSTQLEDAPKKDIDLLEGFKNILNIN
jgi:HK97 family phage prohead protease